MSRTEWAISAVGCALYVALAHYFSIQMGDDAFIFYRVADNVLSGHGPVFNPGERVEAYSSPAWLGLLVLARKAGLGYFAFSRVAGLLLVAIGVLASARTARALGASVVGQSLVLLACAMTGSIHYWAPAGLETSLYVAVLSLTALAIARGNFPGWMVCTALLGIVRPEGMGMLVASTVAMAIAHGTKALKRPVSLVVVVPFLLYFGFRLAYFGVPFPNTYYAKATGQILRRLGRGAEYELWLLVGLGMMSIVIARRWWRARNDFPGLALIRAQAGVLALVYAIAGVVLVGGGDWMWGHRLSLPAFPILFAVLATIVRKEGPWRPYAMAAASLLVINDDLPWPERLQEGMWFGFDGWKFMKEQPKSALKYRFVRPLETIGDAILWKRMDPSQRVEGTMTDASREVGAWLRDHTTPDTLIAVNHAGAVPFYAQRPALDMTGLADIHIAREVTGDLHEKYDPAYVLRRKPKYIVLNSRTQPDPAGVWYHEGYWDGETALVKHPDFGSQYVPRPEFWRWDYSDHRGNFILIYERIDQP